ATVTTSHTVTVTTTTGGNPGAAAAAGAAAASSGEEDSTDWGWVAFAILAFGVCVGAIVWWWRGRHPATPPPAAEWAFRSESPQVDDAGRRSAVHRGPERCSDARSRQSGS